MPTGLPSGKDANQRYCQRCGPCYYGQRLVWLLIVLISGVLLTYSAPPTMADELEAAAPIVTNVTPRHAYNDAAMTVTISGAGFIATPIVTLLMCYTPHTVLSDAMFEDSTTLTATVPPGLAEGVYQLNVTNPDGLSALPIDLVVVRRGDESFGPWTTTSAMTTPRWNFATVVANGALYAIGGNGRSSMVHLSSVERAPINPDGSLGAWQIVGALTSPRAGAAAVAMGNSIYVLGGAAGYFEAHTGRVERLMIAADGSLEPAQIVSEMMFPRANLAAVAANGHIYALGGTTDFGPPVTSVERAAVDAAGMLSTWELTSSMSMVRSSAVAVNGYIYAIGGDNSVERAQINADGSLRPWHTISALTSDRNRAALVVAGGHLFALGGTTECQTALNSVERALVYADGCLGPWERSASMLEGRSHFAAVAAYDRIYALGGASDGNALHVDVEYASAANLTQEVYLPLVVR